MTAPEPGQSKLRVTHVGQISLLVRDASRAEAWYRKVLGLAHLFTFGDLVFFDCAGTRLFIRAVSDSEWRPSSIIYFAVPEMQQSFDELSARGAKVVERPELIHRHPDGVEEWMAFFEDPDGNTLALMARVEPAG